MTGHVSSAAIFRLLRDVSHRLQKPELFHPIQQAGLNGYVCSGSASAITERQHPNVRGGSVGCFGCVPTASVVATNTTASLANKAAHKKAGRALPA